MIRRVLARLTAPLLVSGAVLGVWATPATAAGACTTNTAVTVVVDFKALGPGLGLGCVAPGKTAAAQFVAAGFTIEQVATQPGMVCRINKQPVDQPSNCHNSPPADAYWSLWWSDGRSGNWVYSNLGAGSLTVPTGGYVAFSWSTGSDSDEPSYDPVPLPSPSSTPSSKPSSQPSHSGTAAPGVPSRSPDHPGSMTTSPGVSGTGDPAATGSATSGSVATGSAAGSGSASDSATLGESASATASGSDQASGPVDPDSSSPAAGSGDLVDDTAAASDGSLPGWVAPAVVVILLAGLGSVAWWRRRHLGAEEPPL